jgi:hypothetical protein
MSIVTYNSALEEGGGERGGHCFSLCEILHSCEFQETSSDMCKGKTEIFCKFFVGNIGLL